MPLPIKTFKESHLLLPEIKEKTFSHLIVAIKQQQKIFYIILGITDFYLLIKLQNTEIYYSQHHHSKHFNDHGAIKVKKLQEQFLIISHYLEKKHTQLLKINLTRRYKQNKCC